MTVIHPTDGQLGARLLADGVLYSLACDTVMVAHHDHDYIGVCDPDSCGWHSADLRIVAANFRRFSIPEGDVPAKVWVIPTTGAVPGLIHRRQS